MSRMFIVKEHCILEQPCLGSGLEVPESRSCILWIDSMNLDATAQTTINVSDVIFSIISDYKLNNSKSSLPSQLPERGVANL